MSDAAGASDSDEPAAGGEGDDEAPPASGSDDDDDDIDDADDEDADAELAALLADAADPPSAGALPVSASSRFLPGGLPSAPTEAPAAAELPAYLNPVFRLRARRAGALHDAIESHDSDFIETLFSSPPEGGFNPVCRELNLDATDSDGLTPLHVAVLSANARALTLLLEAGAEVTYRSNGYGVLHFAASLGPFPQHRAFALAATRALLAAGADPAAVDDLGRTPLHLAAQWNLAELVPLLAAPQPELVSLAEPGEQITGQVSARDKDKNTPLHLAAQFGATNVAALLLKPLAVPAAHTEAMSDAALTSVTLPAADVSAANSAGWTPLHAAAYYAAPTAVAGAGWDASPVARLLLASGADAAAVDTLGRTPAQWFARNSAAPAAATATATAATVPLGITWSRTGFNHFTSAAISRRSSPPPENVRRLQVLLNRDDGVLRSAEFAPEAAAAGAGAEATVSSFAGRVEWNGESKPAPVVDILRCHEYSYIHDLEQAASSLEQASSKATEALVNRLLDRNWLAPDVAAAAASGEAENITLAHLDGDTAVSAGSYVAAKHAAGLVIDAVDRVVSGRNKAVFCALRPPGHHAGPTGVVHNADRVGSSNGFCFLNNLAIGAAYARCVHRVSGVRRVALVDFDVHHGNGTEAIVKNIVPNVHVSTMRDEYMSELTIKRRCYKPWLDSDDVENVFFASVHGRRGDDGAGPWFYPDSGTTSAGVEEAVAVGCVTGEDVPASLTCARTPQVLNVGMPAKQAVRAWRQVWRHAIIPRLLEFKPDVLFISAGFDAHKRDDMNLGYLGIDERDYYWLTKQLVKVANTVSQGRIVSALEGGYRIAGKAASPFAKSVAAHVRALAEGCQEKWDPEAARAERAAEDAEVARIFADRQRAVEAAQQQALARAAARAAAEAAAAGAAAAGAEPCAASAAAAAAASVLMMSVPAASDEAPSRPRRARAAVDYVALNAELELQAAEEKRRRLANANGNAK
jgi:acetoin utilization deacetylase AcuC-like enzyme/ankyrin repeat protein